MNDICLYVNFGTENTIMTTTLCLVSLLAAAASSFFAFKEETSRYVRKYLLQTWSDKKINMKKYARDRSQIPLTVTVAIKKM